MKWGVEKEVVVREVVTCNLANGNRNLHVDKTELQFAKMNWRELGGNSLIDIASGCSAFSEHLYI